MTIAKERYGTGRNQIPPYSKGEEVANMVTHIVGGAFAVFVLFACVIKAAFHHYPLGIVTAFIYGISMVVVYVISSIYHGLDAESSFFGKVIMRNIDHCDIYGLIVGSFMPIVLDGVRKMNPTIAWISFGISLFTAVVGIVFTAIDFEKYKAFSYGAYFICGWSVIMTVKEMLNAYSIEFLILLIVGGIVYTSGMIFYVLEDKGVKYAHSIFHIFILGGSIIQFIPIFKYCF